MALRELIAVVALTGIAAIDPPAAAAHPNVPGVLIESFRTAHHGVRDSVLTFARTTRAFVFGGAAAAEDTWYDNAEATREHAQQNADRVRAEAGIAPRRVYRDYRDDDRRYDRDSGPGYRDDDYHRHDEPLPPAVPDGDGY